MNSFAQGFMESQHISQTLLTTLRELGEYRGKQTLFMRQAPGVLETLRKVAIVRSTESSNRIEGITAPEHRIEAIVAEKTTPQNRSEQEIAGYRDVLNSIHTNAQHMKLVSSLILQLHRDLYQYIPGAGGRWKNVDNVITETFPNGSQHIRFKPLSAFQTPDAVDVLHKQFEIYRGLASVDHLLLIATYVFDFLCIHPFLDGNGRVSRLLTLLLLYQHGYEVGRYISLEQQVEKTREHYYEALNRSSNGWHESKHNLLPWWEYFLGVMMVPAYREFERQVGLVERARGGKRQRVKDTIGRLPIDFTYKDIALACPDISRPTITRALVELREAGEIELIRRGRDAVWRRRN